MLDLMDFKEEFISHCRSTLCESGPGDIKIEERKVNKSQRGELNGILFIKEGLLCAPTFYIEDFYKAYKDGAPVEDLSHDAVDSAVQSMEMARLFANNSSDMVRDTDRLRVRMLNKNKNKEYLKDLPYRELGCGFVYIAEAAFGEYGAVITKGLLKDFKMSRNKLFNIAIKNTAKQFPAVLHDLGESIAGEHDDCVNLLQAPSGHLPAGAGPGFVLTNTYCFWGAGALFYPGMIDRLHEMLGGDFYVLPSSVHELILIPAEDQDPQKLADIVRSANRSVVKENEILADDLYICESGDLNRVSYGGVIPKYGDRVC